MQRKGKPPIEQKTGNLSREAAAMNEFPAVLFFGVMVLLWVPRLGGSTNLPLIVTALPLAAAAYMVLSKSYSPDQERWAVATGAVILGYWMKPSAR
jgi:hypothetical protein